MLTIDELKKLHDKAYQHNSVTRERAANDLVFARITQWDDESLNESQLAFRGEFNVVKKASRHIMSDLTSNSIQVDFEPVDEGRDDAADLLDGMYRADSRLNSSLEAFEVAQQDIVDCGFSAWEMYTEYSSLRGESNHQVIRRRPIYEANNTAFCDPNAKRLDKSDAIYWSILTSYSEDAYIELVEELTGREDHEIKPSNFSSPEISCVFPWIQGESAKFWVTRFYHREKVKDKLITMVDVLGFETTLRESDLKDVMDDMIDEGFEIVSEKVIDRWQVTRYIASGEEILKAEIIPGEYMPVIPVYGERYIIEGEEHWEGIVRLAKDPQRLRNFQLSYLADIVSQSPREKPIFLADQIAGHEDMYSLTGADNNYPYLLQNRFDGANQELPIGPVGTMPAPNIPPALTQSIMLTREAISDVADPGMPQDVADPDLSGKAIYAIQNRIDQQSYVYQHHMKHAMRYDGVVYASMAAEVYDVPRNVSITKPDGSREKIQTMQTVLDNETGEFVTLHDINNVEFNVYSDIGPSYTTKKEQTVDRLTEMRQGLPPGDPLGSALMLTTLTLMDGVNLDHIREYAKRQLILGGFKEPETEEEAQILAQAQQAGNQPSAEMLLAMAEMKKGDADLMREQRENAKFQIDAINAAKKLEIDGFGKQTDRIKVQVDAQKVGADINYKRVDTFGKQLDNQEKIIKLRQPAMMQTDELLKELGIAQ